MYLLTSLISSFAWRCMMSSKVIMILNTHMQVVQICNTPCPALQNLITWIIHSMCLLGNHWRRFWKYLREIALTSSVNSSLVKPPASIPFSPTNSIYIDVMGTANEIKVHSVARGYQIFQYWQSQIFVVDTKH